MQTFRILVADDDPSVRHVAVMRFKALGYDVDEAENGAEAVRLCIEEGRRYDVILMDYSMPVMTGDEAIRALKAHPATRHIPIIALTANDPTLCEEAGADEVVLKPYSGRQLAALVERLAVAP